MAQEATGCEATGCANTDLSLGHCEVVYSQTAFLCFCISCVFEVIVAPSTGACSCHDFYMELEHRELNYSCSSDRERFL